MGHEPGLQADMLITDIAVYLCPGNKSGNRINNNNINRVAAYKNLCNFKGLLSVIRLRNKQVINIDTEAAGVGNIQGMLSIDKGGGSAALLCFGNYVQGQGGFAGRLRTVNLSHPAYRDASDADCNIKAQSSRGNCRHFFCFMGSQPHDRAFTKLFLNLVHRIVESFAFLFTGCHTDCSLSEKV